MKKILCLMLVMSMLLPLSGCSDILGGAVLLFAIVTSADNADRDDIFEFVCEKEDELLQAIKAGDFSAFENKGIIKSVDADEEVVDFDCGGAGIGSGTFYVGFYYSYNNDMKAVWCAPPSSESLLPCGKGFEWREPDGDNRYYTEHICGDFYYYEASF